MKEQEPTLAEIMKEFCTDRKDPCIEDDWGDFFEEENDKGIYDDFGY